MSYEEIDQPKGKRKLKKGFVTAFVTMAIILTFVLGFGAGRFVGGNSQSANDPLLIFKSVYNLLVKEFYFGEESQQYGQQLIDNAISGMVNSQGDIHTEYMSTETLASFTDSLQSTFVGIGVSYQVVEGDILVVSVIRNSPAEASGLQQGDLIVGIDGVACNTIEEDDLPAKIKGVEGTKVKLTVIRDNREMEFVVIRGVVSNTVYSKMLEDNVGLLEIESFASGTGEEVGNHLAYLKQHGAKKLIIDLRDNGGGYVSTLDTICSYFMNDGDIIMREYYRNEREYIDRVKANKDHYEYENIVILINGNSASCSEVFTMAMIENCGAVTIGTTSYGKGVAQVTKVFGDGSALKYTDCIWKSGQGVYVGDNKGIQPTYTVRLAEALYQPYLALKEDESYGYDCVSEVVANSQNMLDFLGYGVDRNDGYFSKATVEAVKKFQSETDMEVSGVIDTKTATALNSAVVRAWGLHKDIYDLQMLKAIEIVNK